MFIGDKRLISKFKNQNEINMNATSEFRYNNIMIYSSKTGYIFWDLLKIIFNSIFFVFLKTNCKWVLDDVRSYIINIYQYN